MAVLKYHDGTGWEPVVSALQGPTGSTGPTGVAVGLPTGGVTGASLIKSSSTDYATEWSSNVGGLVHINTTSFTSVASISLPDNTFTSTYSNYRIFLDPTSTPSTGTPNIGFRMRASGVDDSGSNYASGGIMTYQNNTTVFTDRNDNATSFIMQRARSPFGGFAVIDIRNPFIAIPTSIAISKTGYDSDSQVQSQNLNGAHKLSSAYDSMTFIISTSTMSGTIRVYGYKD